VTAASYATSTAYDSLNNPTNVSWNPVPTQTFNSSQSVTFDFSYDANNRRINQTATNKSWWSYPTAASSVCYASNALNQYSSFGAFGACGSSTPITPTYDANGDLTCDGSFNYSYDAERHLTEIQAGACGSPTTTVATYVYDAQERRKSKIVGSTTTIYVTDADNREVLEYDGTTGAQENWYAYGLGSNDALNQMNLPGNTRETLVPDAQGSVIASLDALSGNLINTGYQTYGESPGLATAGFHYTAQYFDPETAGSAHEPNGLYYYRSRMYSPTLGRFLQPDTAGYSAGMNLYAYVGNDPPNNGDATGQASPSPIAMGDYTTGLIACGGDTNCRAQYQNSMDEGGLALSLGGVAVAGCIAACAEIGAGIGLVGGGKMAIGFTFGFGGAQIAGYGV
jgi:RHS repeat-associated protein